MGAATAVGRIDVLGGIDSFVARVAHGLTRRRLLGAASGTALGVALGTTIGPSRSKAYLFGGGHVCGPSPYCDHSLRCSGWYCSGGNVRWSPYDGSSCGSNDGKNCWSHCDADTNYVRWICCDCCVGEWPGLKTDGSNPIPCSGCPSGGWYRCVCHGSSGSC
jgi:hypothetical protein